MNLNRKEIEKRISHVLCLPISKIIHSLESGYWHEFSGSVMSELISLSFSCSFLCDHRMTLAPATSSSRQLLFFPFQGQYTF